jgi:hypothetical protein
MQPRLPLVVLLIYAIILTAHAQSMADIDTGLGKASLLVSQMISQLLSTGTHVCVRRGAFITPLLR